MFVVIVEHALHEAEVIGPFPHKEDAESYAHKNCASIWRVVPLKAPSG